MNTLDIILGVPLVFGAIQGYRRGLLMQIVSLLALLLAVLGGLKFLHWAMALLDANFDINGSILPYLAFLFLFLSILAAAILVGKFVKKIVDYTLLGSFDNIAGAISGVVKWGFILSIGLILLAFVNYEFPKEWQENSYLYLPIKNVFPWLFDVISPVIPFAQEFLDEIMLVLDQNGTPL